MNRIVLLLMLMVFTATLANQIKQTEEPEMLVEIGKASFYADRFTGRKTASGEIYQPHLLTAAHKTLPFGTLVKVTCKESQKSVVVKINDRGPFTRHRIIDLSKSAFQAINTLNKGEITVEVEVVEE